MLALLLLICWPLVELLVAIKVADTIGVLATVVALLAGIPLGMWLLRAQGRAAWRRISAALAGGRPPAKEGLDGALVLLGAALLIVPGFICDLIGLALLLPPTRSLARRGLTRNLRRRLLIAGTRFAGGSRPHDVDSTATDIERPQLQR